MEKIEMLTESEFTTLITLKEGGFDKYFANFHNNMRTALRKAIRFCENHGISEEEFWEWVND